MSPGNLQEKAGRGCSRKPQRGVRLAYTCLVSALVFLTLTLALVAYLTISFIKKTPARATAAAQFPSFVQVQVFGQGAGAPGEVVLDPEKNPWLNDLASALRRSVEFRAVDPAIRAEVRQRLACAAGERLSVSGLVRFRGGGHELDGAAKDRIDDFRRRLGGRASKWGVFGFASEEGEREMNRALSQQRACAVKQYLCKPRSCAQAGAGAACPQAGTETGTQGKGCGRRRDSNPPGHGAMVESLGERHFINGVADSRSVVIAACLPEPDQAEPDPPPCAASE